MLFSIGKLNYFKIIIMCFIRLVISSYTTVVYQEFESNDVESTETFTRQ